MGWFDDLCGSREKPAATKKARDHGLCCIKSNFFCGPYMEISSNAIPNAADLDSSEELEELIERELNEDSNSRLPSSGSASGP